MKIFDTILHITLWAMVPRTHLIEDFQSTKRMCYCIYNVSVIVTIC